MTRRAINHLAIAIGLLALACGGGDADTAMSPAPTAGMEVPAPGEPSPAVTPEPAPFATSEPAPIEPTEPSPFAQNEPAPPVSAEPPGSVGPSGAGSNGVDISDPEVTAFADVIVRLAILEQQGMERVQAGETPDQVANDLQPHVEQVFEGTAISAERFNEIAKLAEEDEALRQRIETRLGERLEEQAPA